MTLPRSLLAPVPQVKAKHPPLHRCARALSQPQFSSGLQTWRVLHRPRAESVGLESPGKDFNQETVPSGDLLRETSGESLAPVRPGQRAAAAVARREPDGMTSSAAPAWNAAGEGAGCPVPIVRSPHPPASRSRAGVAERPWGPFPSAARAGTLQTALSSSVPVPVVCATLRFWCP